MRGVDTNVLVRFVTADHPDQSAAARELIEGTEARGERIHINATVLCELCWTLRGGAYRYDRPSIAAVIQTMLATRTFEFEHREPVVKAVADYGEGRADFADYLIGYCNEAAGCSDTVTFDEALEEQRHFTLI